MKPKAETRKKLHEAALSAPKHSGVYLWKDETGGILYVGKAKSLKSRLLSYFSSTKDVKTGILISRAHSLDYITTSNEYEALLLENTLIKQHSPRYNISLKDGKTYPVIKITNEPFPRIFRTRRIQKDGAKYYGPFPNVPAVDGFLDFVKKHYKFRQCRVLHKRKQPCLYYHIGMCSAPCCGRVTEDEYRREVREVSRILEGTSEAAVKRLEKSMKEAAQQQHFEQAARLRDGIAAIGDLRGQNAVVDMDPEARDYIAWASKGIMVTFSVLRMRSGRLVGRDLYRVRSLKDEEEILTEFLMAFYTNSEDVPPRIFVPTEKGLTLARRWFSDVLGCKTHIETVLTILDEKTESVASPTPNYAQVNTEKRHTTAMAMAYFNAKEDAARRLRERGDFPALEELRSLLNLSHIPARIEGIDISHIGGRLPVASLISFHNGTPDRKNYRIYRLKTTDGIIDDFASMREVTSRRFTRIINEQGELPDLLVIDGGIGQVNAVQGVLDALSLEVPVLGLAERDEEIYMPGNSKPLKLPRRSDALRLLQRVRDESHRFATSRNQKLRTRENTRLLFEDLPGVGPKKAAILLKNYGSPEKMISKTSVPEGPAKIASLLGLSVARAKEVLAALPGIAEEQEKRKIIRSGYQIKNKTNITELALQAGSKKSEDT
ncbi:MAG TPA: excinuclease ABC subunit UvrC [Treponema sp.]|nr:excinuclease ABC subunit UvrC [Treponema sp.]